MTEEHAEARHAMRQAASDGRPWPCCTKPTGTEPDRLVSLLYILFRDHLHPGDVEARLVAIRESEERCGAKPTDRWTRFSNPHLEGLARATAAFLLADS